MKAKLIIFVFLCALKKTEGSRSDFKRLQSKVDFFLNSILDLNLNIQELQESVNDLENQNTSCVCDLQQGNVARVDVEDNTGHHKVSTLFIEEFETKMTAVQRGFREEKSAIRKLQMQQANSISDIARNVDDSKTELRAEITQHLDETAKVVTNVTDTLKEHRDIVSSEFIKLSDELNDVNTTCERHVKDIESKVKALSSLFRLLFVLQANVNHKAFGTSVYMFHTETLNWTEAQQKCQEDGLHLAEINDDKENEFVNKLVGNNIVWLGATDVDKEGDWRWATSGLNIMASLWNTGEPNNVGGQEHCLHNHGTKLVGFNDRNCEAKFKFVCEFELDTSLFDS